MIVPHGILGIAQHTIIAGDIVGVIEQVVTRCLDIVRDWQRTKECVFKAIYNAARLPCKSLL